MGDFYKMIEAAVTKDAKKLSKLLLHDNTSLYNKNKQDLTPAGYCAYRGNFDSVLWLKDNFDAPMNSVYCGAILGEHILSLDELQQKLPLEEKHAFHEYRAFAAQGFAQIGNNEQLQLCIDTAKNRASVISQAVCGAAFSQQVGILNELLDLKHDYQGV